MNQQVSYTRTPSVDGNGRGLSQTLFVLIGLGIITGGLWTLYMADAPYHPEVPVAESQIFLASD